ncbi:hypothetical protein FEDK69T_12090 [Flavobacterium enshiense DK69]|uniref:Uncharacterized protein n=1 Tax=Flavobacterium enshiense DK69 TaxID=1107311 RepID=V6SAV8_9FLAO|nr:hypothetical protein [Flavobacterium enshiense]ESU23798.1 hypothetical protein FEDK69T_12090 [Flavobacterium enshiense DK69]KGO96072.1 hypothetical protein Q767_07360 [Flavobacterium enshiense DK69]
MVRIVNYQQRQAEDGRTFFLLELQGGIEMVKSQETGKFYVTARKAVIPSTFDEVTCKALIGTELPGAVEKVECEPYDYTIRDTGEVITISHRFEYVEQEKAITHRVEKSNVTLDYFMENVPSGNSFSTNGALAH